MLADRDCRRLFRGSLALPVRRRGNIDGNKLQLASDLVSEAGSHCLEGPLKLLFEGHMSRPPATAGAFRVEPELLALWGRLYSEVKRAKPKQKSVKKRQAD